MRIDLRHALIPVPALAILAAGWVAKAEAQQPEKPKLILQITVDQLRGDLPSRYYDRLGEGGFRHLMENGTVYQNAHRRRSQPVAADNSMLNPRDSRNTIGQSNASQER